MTPRIIKTITVHASVSTVWKALTNANKVRQWMAETEMEFEVITDWKEGSPIVMRGFHHTKFENRGTILRIKPEDIIRYNYLSSLSRLPDKPENYTIIEFHFAPLENQTILTFTATNFPTEAILKHIDFYWGTTLEILKKLIEKN
jgi:uncharacterized protein YndB with AHSA1/START domain